MSIIDLSLLPAPDFVEVIDYETILAERKARLVSLYPADEQAEISATLAIESEPITRILQENAYRETVLRQRVNDAGRAKMLAYAKGNDLENLAAEYKLKRLTITPEDTTTTPATPAVMESDDSLRERTQEAYEALSTAGPRGAYVAHARNADGRVADATAISPDPCDAVVTILSTEGDGTAGEDLIKIVTAALSDEDVRPVGDRLVVQSANIVHYAIDASLVLSSTGPEAEITLAAANASLSKYVAVKRKLGRDINRSAIMAALHVEGVTRVDLTAPAADLSLDDTQAGYCDAVSVVKGGVND
jgi:phage-related baseplate assembly protein